MNDKEHAEAILETARKDLRALRAMHDTEAFSDEIFGFHAQQSVDSMSTFVDLNAFAVQYRYESLYVDEEALNREELTGRIEALLGEVTAAIA